ncbi:MAG: CapA family protein [Lachnospiraceae bacterium]|nr:CapA family protein [Lachnospiraceae bacterium]
MIFLQNTTIIGEIKMCKSLKKQILLLFILVVAMLTGCGSSVSVNAESSSSIFISEPESAVPLPVEIFDPAASPEPYPVEDAEKAQTSESFSTEPAFEEYDITLMALGDNLIHMGVVHTGKQTDGSLNYNFLFDGISDFLNKADIKIINQETPLAGNELGFHGYPNFNSPTEIGDAIVDAGFNVVLHASNHSADQGISGLDSCVTFWRNYPEVLLTGIHEPVENPEIPLLTIKDKTFAILNYTYGPNYGSAPENLASRMNILCSIDSASRQIDFTTLNPQVIEDIKEAEQIADMVIVCPHWGTEYATTPSNYQENFAKQMTEAGADVIIGTHPHVVQPVSLIEADNGNTSLCYYSLGNYVSTQKNGQSMLEGMAWINFHVTENGISLSLEDTGIIPLVCHYTSGPVRIKNIYLLEDYTEELASSHGIINYGGISFHLDHLIGWSEDILGEWVITADQALNH